jgi:arylsulfatase A-like enzyme
LSISRRRFLGSGAAGIAVSGLSRLQFAQTTRRPNIVWIVCHDVHAPLLGCYGNKLAATPTIDGMAERGVQYQNAFTTAPVCAPSRFALVTGMYAQMCGPAHDMRANGALPVNTKPLPLHMRAAGYYCTNNVFTDYNMAADQDALWDDCDIKAHWRNRPAGKPFFSVYNYLITHESHIFGHVEPKTDPGKVTVPPFLPDKPAVRSILARNIDMVNTQDGAVAHLLAELKEDSLADDTFVFFMADHGGVHPRSKRYCFDDGLHVPLIVQIPKNFAHLSRDPVGHASKRVVSHVDMAPTTLALAGVPVPSNMVGTAFMGAGAAQPRRFAISMRDRMDERYDLTYSVRDERYRYTRNYASQRIYAQHEAYEWQSEAYQAWEQAHMAGELNEVQSRFWKAKPVEEFYDIDADPHSINNLIDAPGHSARVAEMRKVLDEHIVTTNDNGFIPEGVAVEGYDASRASGGYPVREILKVANLGLQRDSRNIAQFVKGLESGNECLRYWNAQGLVVMPKLPADVVAKMEQRLSSESSVVVRCALAEALIAAGDVDAARAAMLEIATTQSNVRFQLRALNVLSVAPIDQLKAHRNAFQKIANESSDEYVPEAARYILFHIDGSYQPSSKVFGAIQQPSAPAPDKPRKPMGDPQI